LKVPSVGGKKLDLYMLYKLVISLDGWKEVSKRNLWDVIARLLDLPENIRNVGRQVKQMYSYFLKGYEDVFFVRNETTDLVAESSQDENLLSKGNMAVLSENAAEVILNGNPKIRARHDSSDSEYYDAEIIEDLGDSYKIKVWKDGKFHLGVVFKDSVPIHHRNKKRKVQGDVR
jgi:hypothetical protein